jgi:hypothetical protein
MVTQGDILALCAIESQVPLECVGSHPSDTEASFRYPG